MQLKEERDQLRARLDDISQQNQQDLADALEQLSLEMEEKAKLEQERIKLDCECVLPTLELFNTVLASSCC